MFHGYRNTDCDRCACGCLRLMLNVRWHEILFIRVVAVLPYAGLLLFVGSPGDAAAPTLLTCLVPMVGSLRSFHYGCTHCYLCVPMV